MYLCLLYSCSNRVLIELYQLAEFQRLINADDKVKRSRAGDLTKVLISYLHFQ